MKRLFLLLLCATLLFTLSLSALAETPVPTPEPPSGDAAPEEPAATPAVKEIATAMDLLSIASDPDGSYVLTADIDLTGVDWIPLAFSGKFDGAGHCLYNLKITECGATTAETYDGNDNAYFTYGCGLFSILNEAEITNLTIRGEQITADPGSHCFVGGLAGIMTKTIITDCQIYDARITLQARSVQNGLGGLVGYAAGGLVRGCTSDTLLVFLDNNAEDIKCEEFLGGAVGCGYVTIDSCNITVNGYCSCHGYVHNGGLLGMFDVPKDGTHVDYIARNVVNGTIHFFENNDDRRAYCQPFVGELRTYVEMFDNTNHFTSDEVFDYSVNLLPENCDQANLTTTVEEPSCDAWGCTVHRCSVCGYQWRDTFVPPSHEAGTWTVIKEATLTESGEKQLTCAICGAVMETAVIPPHVAGEWVTVLEPDYGKEGLRELHCADCDLLLESESIPALKPVQEILLSTDCLEMNYKDESELHATVSPADASNQVVIFSSSDPSVVTVDTDGTVHAVGKGKADIQCHSGDGFATAVCQVSVTYTPLQWFIRNILFGWLWY